MEMPDEEDKPEMSDDEEMYAKKSVNTKIKMMKEGEENAPKVLK